MSKIAKKRSVHQYIQSSRYSVVLIRLTHHLRLLLTRKLRGFV